MRAHVSMSVIVLYMCNHMQLQCTHAVFMRINRLSSGTCSSYFSIYYCLFLQVDGQVFSCSIGCFIISQNVEFYRACKILSEQIVLRRVFCLRFLSRLPLTYCRNFRKKRFFRHSKSLFFNAIMFDAESILILF